MAARILVADGDRTQADLIRRDLEREGHEAAVVHDGRAAVEWVRRRTPDLVVLDLMLPHIDGLRVCRILRSDVDIPIIVLTTRASEDDLVRGLAVGADDYLTKPYRPRELLARVGAVLRRAAPRRYRVGDLVVDIPRREVRAGSKPVGATPAEFTILACLAAAPGRVFTRQLLLDRIGGFGRNVTGRAIDMHVLNLRRKIEPAPARPRYLLTVYGVGYKLVDGRPH